MKVFLDTVVLASGLTTRGLCADLFAVVLESHQLLTSDSVLHELERILPGRLGQSEEVTQAFIQLLSTHALVVKGEPPFPSLPDPDDEPIVAAALEGEANVFVTGDKALLQVQSIEDLGIISPRNFWEMLTDQ